MVIGDPLVYVQPDFLEVAFMHLCEVKYAEADAVSASVSMSAFCPLIVIAASPRIPKCLPRYRLSA